MKKRSAIIIGGTCWILNLSATWAQQPENNKPAPAIIIAGAPMNALDSNRVKQLFYTALREKTIGNSELSSELYNRILQIDPMNDAAMFELARIKKFQKQPQESKMLLERAVTVNPDNEWYWIALIEQYQSANEHLKLENALNELIRIKPDKPDYYFDKANAQVFQKKFDSALSTYDLIEKQFGFSDELVRKRQQVYLKQGKTGKAAEEIEKLIKLHPEEIRYYLSLSEIYNSNGLTDKALKVLLRGEKINPEHPLIHLALADTYRTQKNKTASFNQLKLAFASPDLDIEQKIRIVMGYFPKFPDPDAKASALELSKIIAGLHQDDAKAQALYGDILVYNEQLTEAKVAYRKALNLNNQIYAIWEQLVRLQLNSNDIENTIKDGEEALTIFPNQAILNYMVGIGWFQKKDYNKAVFYLKNAVSLETENKIFLTQAYAALGDCYHQLKNDSKSDEAYENSISFDANNAYTLNNYAYYLSLRGERLDKAEQMSRRSNELRPGSASFQDTYAWILFKQKKYAEAKSWMEKAVSNENEISAVQLEHYGDILFHLGDIEKAIIKWKSAREAGLVSPILEQKIKEQKYVE
jgi:tetratricopeptide (TPR) repeat protein